MVLPDLSKAIGDQQVSYLIGLDRIDEGANLNQIVVQADSMLSRSKMEPSFTERSMNDIQKMPFSYPLTIFLPAWATVSTKAKLLFNTLNCN